jgi:hypothetical protein
MVIALLLTHSSWGAGLQNGDLYIAEYLVIYL